MWIKFQTPTDLDVRAFMTFGLHAKPNSTSPIGYFGTGLKMAIATLVRNRIPITIHTMGKTYSFYTSEGEFRGATYQQIKVKLRNFGIDGPWNYKELPFTTQLARNWELWMAFRELESNTRDEGGTTSAHLTKDLADCEPTPSGPQTTILVGPSQEFHAQFEAIDTIFLPNALRAPDDQTPTMQVFDRHSKYVYYRGMRVLELRKPSILTYNLLEQSALTEDRTLKDAWYLPWIIARYMVKSSKPALIHRLLNATDENYEYELPFDTINDLDPSPEFVAIAKNRIKPTSSLPGSLGSTVPVRMNLSNSSRMAPLYHRYVAPPPETDPTTTLHYRFRQWLSGYNHTITDEAERDLLYKVATYLEDEDA